MRRGLRGAILDLASRMAWGSTLISSIDGLARSASPSNPLCNVHSPCRSLYRLSTRLRAASSWVTLTSDFAAPAGKVKCKVSEKHVLILTPEGRSHTYFPNACLQR